MKNLKKYEREFDKADKELKRARQLEETKGKRQLRAAYRERVARLKELKSQQRAERMALLDGYDSEDESNYVMHEFSIETILGSKEEVV